MKILETRDLMADSTSERWDDPIDITKEQWIDLLQDQSITSKEDIVLLQLIYASDDYRATASQLVPFLKMKHHAPINSQVGRWGKRIVNGLNIQAPWQKYGEGVNWWHVPFLGEATKEGYYWTLRPELKEAIDELDETGEIPFVVERNIAEEIVPDASEQFYEGAKKLIYVNRYERNSIARDRCIKHYGTICIACGFDFEKMYGEMGKDVIHVHHLKPLSEISKNYRIDPIRDLRPVCPNCHVMIHRRNPAYSIDEIVVMMKDAASRKVLVHL